MLIKYKVNYIIMKEKNMKLNKRVNRVVGDTTYHKYSITIPKKYVDDLKWSEKTELKMKMSGKKITIEKK